jgi:hypothetical protein
MSAELERLPGANKTAVALGGPIHSLDEAYRLSQALAMAGLMPTALRGKPSDVLAIILYGQDLGLSPMQAIQGIYVVDGRPSLSAQLWLAKVRGAGHRAGIPCAQCGRMPDDHRDVMDPERKGHAYAPDHDSSHATVRIVRRDTGEQHQVTYDIEQAVQAGRVQLRDGKPYARSANGKPLNWETNPKAMVLARAVSECCRFIAPEIALGFYSQDEVEEIAERETVEAVRVDEPTPVVDADPEQAAAEVAAVEAEFVDDTPPDLRQLYRREQNGAEHLIHVGPRDDGFYWECNLCGAPGTAAGSTAEEALADHAHFAETGG